MPGRPEKTRRGARLGALLLAGAAATLSFGSGARQVDAFPEPRPATRAEAVELLCGGAEDPGRCLRARLRATGDGAALAPPAVRRSLALLARGIVFADERVSAGPDDLPIRHTVQSAAFDRLDPRDANADGMPDVLEATISGVRQARELLVGQLELARPERADVLLVELGDRLDGYVLAAAGHDRPTTLVLDATPPGGAEAARKAALRLYTLATVLGNGSDVPGDWAEAVSLWAVLAVDGHPDAATVELFDRRLRRLDAGLTADDPDLVAGNALWLAFLEEAYGRTAVRLTLEELAKPVRVPVALDRAVRRASRDDLASAFREFHLWSLLVGPRADGLHFPFAARLASPAFAARRDGLPALSVQSEPPIAGLGATHVRLVPGEVEGGLRVHFEGEFDASWEVDLLLVRDDGALHRLPLALSAEGRGSITVPLRGLGEALLLVRNLGSAAGTSQRYSYTARREAGFPYELSAFDARRIGKPTPGVLLRWETASEQQLIGFRVMRRRQGGGLEQMVNPVWVPAAGTAHEPTAYRFLDRTAEAGVAYEYRIEGITVDGLLSPSEPLAVAPAPRETR